jgi:hypothetical protein
MYPTKTFEIYYGDILIQKSNTRNYSAWVYYTLVVVEYPTRI